jgi:hypothetical protein
MIATGTGGRADTQNVALTGPGMVVDICLSLENTGLAEAFPPWGAGGAMVSA